MIKRFLTWLYSKYAGECAAYGHTLEDRMYNHYGQSLHPYKQCTRCPYHTEPEGEWYTFEEVYNSMLERAGFK